MKYQRPAPGRKIKVERRSNGLFVGNVLVEAATNQRVYGRKPRPAGPWLLTDETLLALGYEQWSRSFFGARLHDCRECRGWFIGHLTAHLCSSECVHGARLAWHKAHKRTPLPHPPSKAAQRRARLAEATCMVCSSPIAPKRLTARFCSGRCRQKHHRNVHRQPDAAAA